MQLLRLATVLGFASVATARDGRHVGKASNYYEPANKAVRRPQTGNFIDVVPRELTSIYPEVKHHKRAGKTIIPQNKNTTRYAVDGKGLPDVHFDIGESYAGLLPISDSPNEKRELYFWFFPSSNPKASDEITIWLNGGMSSWLRALQSFGSRVTMHGLT